MRRKARVDNSHSGIVSDLNQIPGVIVKDVSKLPNFCDLLVLFRGQTYHIEAKTKEYASKAAKADRSLLLTEGERKHMQKCEQTEVPYYIVFDADEVLKAIGAV